MLASAARLAARCVDLIVAATCFFVVTVVKAVVFVGTERDTLVPTETAVTVVLRGVDLVVALKRAVVVIFVRVVLVVLIRFAVVCEVVLVFVVSLVVGELELAGSTVGFVVDLTI